MNLNAAGFLGTNATLQSDISLILGILIAITLTIGVAMAIRKQFDIHQRIQTIAVSLNILQILFIMLGSYFRSAAPGIPSQLNSAYYQVAFGHALIGFFAATFGTFVMMRGNNLVPKALRFNNYKLFMRIAYVLYMLVTILGIWTYYQWYMVDTPVDSALEAGENELIVPIGGFAFNPDDIIIPVGTTLTWQNLDNAPHTVTADEGAFVSELLQVGDTFTFTFNEIGDFQYFCELHGSVGGFGMTAMVRVVPVDEAPEDIAIVALEDVQLVSPPTPVGPTELALSVSNLHLQTGELSRHIDHIVYNLGTGDIAGVTRHSEHVYNVLAGSEDSQFGDLNNDGTIQNPGDGFGLLTNGEQLGYLPEILNLVSNSDVVTSVENMTTWTEEMRGIALTLSQATDLATVGEPINRLFELDNLLRQDSTNIILGPASTEEAHEPATTEEP